MSTVKVIEIIAESKKSFEDAINQGIAQASGSVENLKSAWVAEQKAIIENGKVDAYRVTMRVSFEFDQARRKAA